MKNVNFAQAYFVGILFEKPKYISKVRVTVEMFDYPYNKIVQTCFESFKKYQHISFDYMLANLSVEEQSEFLACTGKSPLTSFAYFVQQERLIYERHIERTLDENVDKFKRGELELQKFKELLELPSAHDGDYMNFEELKETLETGQRNLRFVGFPRLRALANLKETDLIVVAGYTGKGKSALALNLLEDFSRNYECTYFNLEMGIASVHKRMISIHSGIPIQELETFKFADERKKSEILKHVDFIKQRKITLISESQSVDSIRDIIAAKNNKHSVVFIDHIGLIKAPGHNLYERMTYTSKELRKMSLDYNTTIIALCQLNRQGAKGKPDLSMLRDSGEIEQSASKIILLYSEEYPEQEKYYIDVAKNRDGRTGSIPIRYLKNSQQIFDN